VGADSSGTGALHLPRDERRMPRRKGNSHSFVTCIHFHHNRCWVEVQRLQVPLSLSTVVTL